MPVTITLSTLPDDLDTLLEGFEIENKSVIGREEIVQHIIYTSEGKATVTLEATTVHRHPTTESATITISGEESTDTENMLLEAYATRLSPMAAKVESYLAGRRQVKRFRSLTGIYKDLMPRVKRDQKNVGKVKIGTPRTLKPRANFGGTPIPTDEMPLVARVVAREMEQYTHLRPHARKLRAEYGLTQ